MIYHIFLISSYIMFSSILCDFRKYHCIIMVFNSSAILLLSNLFLQSSTHDVSFPGADFLEYNWLNLEHRILYSTLGVHWSLEIAFRPQVLVGNKEFYLIGSSSSGFL